MKRFGPKLLSGLTAISLLFAVACLFDCWRSRYYADDLNFNLGKSHWDVGGALGQFGVEWNDPWPQPGPLHYRCFPLGPNWLNVLTGPSFTFFSTGTARVERQFAGIVFDYGRECVVLAPGGQIDRESPTAAFQRAHQPGALSALMAFWDISIPLWMLVILMLMLPLGLSLRAAFVRFERYLRLRRAARRGKCPFCGYDLRATPQRCPECGKAVKGEGRHRV
jgi:hypothetical protein